jgi:hypothetical protein
LIRCSAPERGAARTSARKIHTENEKSARE